MSPPATSGQDQQEMPANRWVFLLGGHDLEMNTLRDLLDAQGIAYRDRSVGWGAPASLYADDITQALVEGMQPVAVELVNDLPQEVATRICWIDHHNDLAGAHRPCALRQAFDMLSLPEEYWTRHHQLVAANDIGHIVGMRALGASDEEMRAIRLAEFAVRGIGQQQLEQTRLALEKIEWPLPDLALVRLPHDHTGMAADLSDPLFGGPGATDMMVIGPTEWSFFGTGKRVLSLAERLGGWAGGALPERGYWGQHASHELERHWVKLVEGWKSEQKANPHK